MRLKIILFFFSCALGEGFDYHPAFLERDEFLKFKVVCLGIVAGYSTMEVIHDVSDEGDEVMHFKLNAWTTPFVSSFYNLKLEYHSVVDKKKLATLYYTENRLEKKSIFSSEMVVFPKKNYYIYKNLRKNEGSNVIFFDERGYDVVASFYLSRCAKIDEASPLTFASFHRKNIYETEVMRLENKNIDTVKWGEKMSSKIIPKMKFNGLFVNQGDIEIYISEDQYRIPLLMTSKISVGRIKAVLVERNIK